MKRQQSGFTIIELVVVIILLGIMAATALPRFMDVTEEAHDSKVTAVQGSLKSGAALFHAQWVAKGQLAAGSDIDWENSLVTNATGYPCGTSCTVVSLVSNCSQIYNNLLQTGAPSLGEAANVGAAVGASNDFTVVLSGADCEFYYTGEKITIAGDIVPLLTYTSATGDLVRTDHTFL